MKNNNFYELFSLDTIETPNSNIVKIINKHKSNFFGINEVYSSSFKKNVIRAWKKHTKMICNILVTRGSIKFVFFDDNFETSDEIILTDKQNKILLIKPKIWFGFKGMKNINTLFNFSNILHVDKEVKNKEYNGEYPKF